MTLNHEIKHLPEACRLVGTYFYHWASMEIQLNSMIGQALKLEQMAEAIICANLKFTDKIHIAKTAVSVSPLLSEDDKRAYKKSLEKVAKQAVHRNTLAHNAFIPLDQEDLVVEFLITKAKGELKFPEFQWSTEDFYEKFREIVASTEAIEKMKNRVGIIPRNSLAAALLGLGSSLNTEPLGFAGLLSPSLEGHMSDMNSASNPKGPDTPPSSEG